MSKKSREKAIFEEEIIDGSIEDWLPEEYEIIEEEQTDFDSEKGFCYYDIIIQRTSDGKFFKGQHIDFGQGQHEYDLEWDEVFPKHINKVIYE